MKTSINWVALVNYIVLNSYWSVFILISCLMVAIYCRACEIYYLSFIVDSKIVTTTKNNCGFMLLIILYLKMAKSVAEYAKAYCPASTGEATVRFFAWKICRNWIFDHREHAFYTQIEKYRLHPEYIILQN